MGLWSEVVSPLGTDADAAVWDKYSMEEGSKAGAEAEIEAEAEKQKTLVQIE